MASIEQIKLCEEIAARLVAEIESVRCLRATAAAKLLNIDENTFLRLGLPKVKLAPGRSGAAVYRLRDIQNYLNSHTVPAGGTPNAGGSGGGAAQAATGANGEA